MRIKLLLIITLLLSIGFHSFSQSYSKITVGNISIEGDKITHKPIIIRELEFLEGDVLTEKELDDKIIRSRQNLLNRSLFNFVTIEKNCNNGICDISVIVIERWYIWPIPIIEYADRNLNVWWETKDLSRLNYGLDLRVENFRGRMENLNIILRGGYDQTFALRWQLPYITKNQIFGMGFDGGYVRNHEVAYATENNKYKFYKSENSYVQQIGYASANATFRPKFNFLHSVSLGFIHIKVDDSVLFYNPNFTHGENEYNFFTISYNYKHDFRDFKAYPLTGYYFDIKVSKTGLGILSDEVNQFNFDFNLDHYFNIWKRWYFAYGFSGRLNLSGDFQPYFLAQGIGLSGFNVRGYELYLINGQNLGIFKSNLKFTIIPTTDFSIKWIKSEKFNKVFFALYSNLFFDMGYAQDKFWYNNNPLNNELLWGLGIGLDLVTYYDMIFRIEYSINKQGNTGLFISLVAPI